MLTPNVFPFFSFRLISFLLLLLGTMGQLFAQEAATYSPGQILQMINRQEAVTLDGATITGEMVDVWGVAESEAGVERVALYVDGTRLETQTEPPWRFMLDSTDYANGAHTLTLEAIQTGTGDAARTTIDVTVSN